MAASDKLRVGIVGASASRGFASIAHIPALQALPQFEIVAVCTTRQATAEAAARRYGARLAFADPAQMAAHPDVDLVTVSVKVPDHYAPVMAAIDAGKHVYCEWPLDRNTDEAARMLDAGRAARRAARRRSARPDVAGDQLRQRPDSRRLCGPGVDRDDDRLRRQLG
ncbi:MAG: Gfo/Idh/MocA family oxidoreductase [Stellaceae bacterium]